jgi:hypothetical protein
MDSCGRIGGVTTEEYKWLDQVRNQYALWLETKRTGKMKDYRMPFNVQRLRELGYTLGERGVEKINWEWNPDLERMLAVGVGAK